MMDQVQNDDGQEPQYEEGDGEYGYDSENAYAD